MVWDYINDGLDPRGANYAAERRTARSARQTAQTNDDLLELQLAEANGYGPEVAARISGRRQAQARRRAWWMRIDRIGALCLIAGIVWFFAAPSATPHSGAVTIEAPSGAQTDPDDARAPVRSAQAPDVDSITSTKEGQAVLMHAVGMSDAQIDAATPAQIEAAKAAFKDTLARRAPSDNGCYDLDGKPVDVCE